MRRSKALSILRVTGYITWLALISVPMLAESRLWWTYIPLGITVIAYSGNVIYSAIYGKD